MIQDFNFLSHVNKEILPTNLFSLRSSTAITIDTVTSYVGWGKYTITGTYFYSYFNILRNIYLDGYNIVKDCFSLWQTMSFYYRYCLIYYIDIINLDNINFRNTAFSFTYYNTHTLVSVEVSRHNICCYQNYTVQPGPPSIQNCI